MDHLDWGLRISALGMGLVFALLALLWGLLALLLRLDGPARAPAPPADPVRSAGSGDAAAAALTIRPAAGTTAPDPSLAAAITVAVLRHRQALREEASPVMRRHAPGALLHASRWVDAGRARQNQVWRRPR